MGILSDTDVGKPPTENAAYARLKLDAYPTLRARHLRLNYLMALTKVNFYPADGTGAASHGVFFTPYRSHAMQVQHPSVFEELKKVDALVDAHNEPERVVERLPFTVRVVRSEEDLLKAVSVRHSAYARHMPTFAEMLKDPEEDDTRSDTAVLLAESKLDGSALGTARIQTNRVRPLNMERSTDLPKWISSQSMAEIRRFGIVRGSEGGLVKMVLVKACFLYCELNEIDWALLGARPPLNRSYEKLMFSDILDGNTYVPLPAENNVPHHVMAFEIGTGKVRWTEASHPMLNFFSYTHHPDIDVQYMAAHEVPRLPTKRLQKSESAHGSIQG